MKSKGIFLVYFPLTQHGWLFFFRPFVLWIPTSRQSRIEEIFYHIQHSKLINLQLQFGYFTQGQALSFGSSLLQSKLLVPVQVPEVPGAGVVIIHFATVKQLRFRNFLLGFFSDELDRSLFAFQKPHHLHEDHTWWFDDDVGASEACGLKLTWFMVGLEVERWWMQTEATCSARANSLLSYTSRREASTSPSTLFASSNGFACRKHGQIPTMVERLEKSWWLKKWETMFTQITKLCLDESMALLPVTISSSSTPNANTSVFSFTTPCMKYSGAK